MYAFEYQRPEKLDEAGKALEASHDNKPLAGGMSIVPVLRHRLASPGMLVDLGKIDELKGIAEVDGRIRIGAMTTHYTVSKSELVKKGIPALVQLAGGIGDPLVRNRGTIGGSLAHNDPAACYPSSILALGATIHTTRRDIEADNYILGTFTTALEPDEIIVAVSFPTPDVAAYIKFINASSRFSVVGIFLARHGENARVGVTGAGHHAFRCAALEQALSVEFTPEAARAVKIPADGLLADTYGSAEYRAYLIPELAARAVEHCRAGTPGAIL
jgi:carbon-monoxide dehydrogenase medium subunit